MKKLYTLLTLILFALITPQQSLAIDDIMRYSAVRTGTIKKGNSGGNSNDDRSSGPQQLICHYSSESITINFPAGIESITITIGETSCPTWMGEVSADAPTAELPSLSGDFLVTCYTDTQQLYSGYLYF